MLREMRHAVRQFRKSPLVLTIVAGTLALGIGANTAIFAVLDSLMLRSLPVEHPQELAWITNTGAYGTEAYSPGTVLKAYREDPKLPATVFAFKGPQPYQLRHGLSSVQVQGELVTGNYFGSLGVRPLLGRMLSEDDERSNSPVAVLSYACWKRSFLGDANVVGQSLTLQNQGYTVIGVVPENFFGTVVGNAPDVFLPFSTAGPFVADDAVIMARVHPGATLAQLQSALEPDFQRVSNARVAKVAAVLPSLAGLIRQLFTRPLVFDASHGISQLRIRLALPVRILMAVVAVVLLIGCINLASLLMMRSMRRRKDFALQMALGASRWDLMRSVIAEALLMVLIGTALGSLVSFALLKVITASIAHDATPGVTHIAPIVLPSGLSARVLAFSAGVLGLTVFVCGLVPALLSTQVAPNEDLKVNGYPMSRRTSRFGRLLAVGQIAVLFVLLFGTSLLLRSFRNLESAQVGFDADHCAVMSLREPFQDLSGQESKAYQQRMDNFESTFGERAMHLPGVLSVAFSNAAPLSGREGAPVDVAAANKPDPTNLHPDVFYSWVSPGYFRTMQISLLAGREFEASDASGDAVKNVIINRALALRLFGGENAVGQRFRMPLTGQQFEVVGVSENTAFHDLREDTVPVYFYPLRSGRVILVRGEGNPSRLIPMLRQLATSIDRSIQIESVNTMREEIGHSLYRDRLVTHFTEAFGLLAVLFALLGIYGTLAFDVRQRSAEIGVRMAMGATAQNMFRMVVSRGMRLGVAGLILGGGMATTLAIVFNGVLFGADAFNVYKPGATGAENFIHIDKGFLFGVSAWDSNSLVLVPAFVLAVCIIAAYFPARGAAGVSPNEALRTE